MMLIEKIKQTGTTDSNYTLGKVLWENSDPTSSFAEQNITLNSDDYDYLEWEFELTNNHSSSYKIIFIKTPKGFGGVASYTWSVGQGALRSYTRIITYTNDTTIHIGTCVYIEGGNNSNDDTKLIPTRVIGYKNIIPTVVQREGEIYSAEEKVIGTWIDNKPIYRKVIDLGSMPNNNSKNVDTGLTHNQITVINMYGVVKASGSFMPLNMTNTNDSSNSLQFQLSSNNTILIRTKGNFSDYSGFAVIEYTKTTDIVNN